MNKHISYWVVISLTVQAVFFRPPVTPLAGEPAPPPQPAALGVTEIVARLQTRYQETRGFQADFVQQVEAARFGYTLSSQGKVFFKKPGKMRWDFSQPAQLLISDGAFLWFYQAAEHQVVKTPFHQAFQSHTPLSFLTGVGHLEDDFAVSLQDTAAETYILNLSPKRDADATGHLTLAVDATTFDIVRATVSDPLGNITRLHFTNITRNLPLPDSLFQFTVPAGADIIEPLPAS